MKALGYLWSLPNTLIGLLLIIFYRPKSVRWSDGCLEMVAGRPIWGGAIAQTWGWVIWYAEGIREVEAVRVHERRHVRQSFIFGVFFLVIYVLHFAYLYLFVAEDNPPYRTRWDDAYFRIIFERRAHDYEREFEAGKHPGAWGS